MASPLTRLFSTAISALTLTGCLATSSISLIAPDSIDGWESLNDGKWTVTNGELYGTKDAAIAKHSLLVSQQSFTNFEARVVYKAIHGDSGFYFRLQPAKNGVGFEGYHAEIRSDGTNVGGIFDVAVDWITKPDPALTKEAFNPNDWNEMVIRAVGKEITVDLNGHRMSAITGERTMSGKLGIQLHANEATEVKFRSILIKEL